MESSFLSGFGLILYLEELQKEEFKKFKTFLKQESLPPGLKHIPWAEVKKASREELADLLNKHYGERQAWDVALTVFDKINRKDLYEKAKTEGPGHTKRYQAHLKKRLRNVWFKGESLIAAHSSLEQRENEYMEDLFASKATGAELPRTVVFIGTRKLGKTTFLIKLMLAWAEGTIYRERFSYVFYFCCREVRQLMATSLSELISRGWPDGSAPIEEILSQPNRLLFIIDSFEKLTCDLEEAELDVCSDCTQEQPAEVILTGLLKKKMLPESSMLIAATPECLEELQTQLENPNVEIMGGLDEQGRKLYFSCTFQNKKQAMHAFNSVKGNEQLYAMCQIPVICWVACSCLKQEMEKGRNVTLTCHRNTSLFTTFILNTFIAKDATRPRQQNRLQLEGLCFLAVEGMWTDTFEFSEEDLRRNGLGEGDIPAFLDMKILQKSWGYENSYSFIHVCVQEFFAALFYMLKKPSDHPNTAVKDVETLLLTYLKRTKTYWIWGGCFLLGLLNAQQEEKLKSFFGSQRSLELKEQLNQSLKSLGERELQKEKIDFLALFYCLFEIDDQVFVKQVLDSFQEFHLSLADKVDLMVSAYCLKKSFCLRKCSVSVQNIFKEESRNGITTTYTLIRWHGICSVLTTNEHLRELRLFNSVLNEPALVILGNELKSPSCHIEKIGMNNVSFSGQSRMFFEMLVHNSHLKCLDLSHTELSDNDVMLLCETLNNPRCNIEHLQLSNCFFLANNCEILTEVVKGNKRLKSLNLAHNCIEEGVIPLCDALCHPDCTLKNLMLAGCLIIEPHWENIGDVLVKSKCLVHLDLSMNLLRDDDLELLCEALRHPNCCLQSLCLVSCSITADGCHNIASVLTRNSNLKNLEIGNNKIQDAGVKIMCEALANPSCHLMSIALNGCHLTGRCCEDLASVLSSSKTLRRLNLNENTLDHDGVAVLCEALKHPDCALKELGLQKDELDEETQRLLTAETKRNPSLIITAMP